MEKPIELLGAKPFVFIDIESTGTDTTKDRVVELCMIKMFKDDEVIFTKRFNPTIPIPESASLVHGIYDKDVMHEATFASHAKEVLDFINDCILIGFNSNRFDFPLLNAEFERCGIEWDYSRNIFVDVGNLYKLLNPRTLTQAVFDYTGKDHSEAHAAEADVRGTISVFFAMLEKHNELLIPLDELALKSNYDKPILDLSGKFSYDKDNDIIFTFGKHINQKAKNHLDFVQWMIRANFPNDTVKICYELIDTYQAKFF